MPSRKKLIEVDIKQDIYQAHQYATLVVDSDWAILTLLFG